MNAVEFVDFLEKEHNWSEFAEIISSSKDTIRIKEKIGAFYESSKVLDNINDNPRTERRLLANEIKGIIISEIEKKFNKKYTKKFEIGVFPTFEYNAFALELPSGEQVCIIDQWFLILFNKLSFVLVELGVKYPDEGAILVAAEAISQIIDELSQKVPHGKRDSQHIPISHFLNSQANFVIGSSIYCEIEKFIIAHEVAHNYLGHTNRNNTDLLFITYNGIQINKLNRTQKNEIEADEFAYKILSNTEPSYREIGRCGPLIFFRFFKLLEDLSVYNHGNSHPSPEERFKIAKKHLWQSLTSDDKKLFNFVDKFLAGMKDLRIILQKLYTENQGLTKRST